jgi:hypothetical protein
MKKRTTWTKQVPSVEKNRIKIHGIKSGNINPNQQSLLLSKFLRNERKTRNISRFNFQFIT